MWEAMPATIKDIAEKCGCTKQTVRNNLKQLGLWEGHVIAPRGPGGAVMVDDEACSAVCDKIMRRKVVLPPPAEPVEAPAASPDQPQDNGQVDLSMLKELYEARISDLREQIDSLQGQVVDLRSQVDVLQSVTDDYRMQNRDLRLAAAEHQKALPAAREEARREGVESEQARIRSLGFFDRLFGNF